MIVNIGELNEAALDTVINAYNDGYDEYVLFLTSGGGEINVAEKIKYIINLNSSITTIVGVEYLFSAAFKLFFEVSCKKEFQGRVIGMAHQTIQSVQINSSGVLYYDNAALKDSLNTADWISLLNRLNVSDDKLKKFKKGEDLYFTNKEMKAFLNITSGQ